MSTVVIKNLPDRLHQRLKQRAERNHRSMTKEVVHLIETGLGADEASETSRPPPTQAERPIVPPTPDPNPPRDGRDALRAALVEQPDGTYINVLGIDDEGFFEELERIRGETRAPEVKGMFDDEKAA